MSVLIPFINNNYLLLVATCNKKCGKSKKNIDRCRKLIRDLLNIFKKESSVYLEESEKTDIFNEVYEAVICKLMESNKGSKNNIIEDVTIHLKKNSKYIIKPSEVYDAVKWVIFSGIAGTCSVFNGNDPTKIHPGRRLYFNDSGVAAFVMRKMRLPKNTASGLLTEHFAYNELLRLISNDDSLSDILNDRPYFSIYNNYELDFAIFLSNNDIYGIEVKTITGDPKSLKIYKSQNFISRGILAKLCKGGHNELFDTIPIFAIGARFPYSDTKDNNESESKDEI